MSTHAPEEVLARIDQLEASGRPEDVERIKLRHFRRHTIRGDARLTPVVLRGPQVDPIEVQLRDVGRGGIAFLLRQRVIPKTSWRITFTDHHLPIASQELIIRHCRAVSDTLFLAGAQFVADSSLLMRLGVAGDEVRRDIDQGGYDQRGDFDAFDQVA